MNTLSLIIDGNGVWWLPSDCRRILLDLDAAGERWNAKNADEWPNSAILREENLGLILFNHEKRIHDERHHG